MKSRTSVILSVIHHHHNPLDSTDTDTDTDGMREHCSSGG
jgi:hypothetical protein